MSAKAFSGKLALITGGSSGIGLELGRQLVREGADLAIVARDHEKMKAAQAALEVLRPGTSIKLYPADVSDYAEVEHMAEVVKSHQGIPDYIFTCAGVARPGYVEELPIDIFRWTMDIDFHGTVNVVKAFLPALLERKSGHIITISSLAGVIGTFGYTAYSGAKFAVRGFADTLRAEMKPRGIKVSIVFPPDTDTPQLKWESQFKPAETAILAGSDKPMPAEEVARIVLREVARGKYAIAPGANARMMYWLATHLGDGMYPLMDFLVKDAIRKKATRKQPLK